MPLWIKYFRDMEKTFCWLPISHRSSYSKVLFNFVQIPYFLLNIFLAIKSYPKSSPSSPFNFSKIDRYLVFLHVFFCYKSVYYRRNLSSPLANAQKSLVFVILTLAPLEIYLKGEQSLTNNFTTWILLCPKQNPES